MANRAPLFFVLLPLAALAPGCLYGAAGEDDSGILGTGPAGEAALPAGIRASGTPAGAAEMAAPESPVTAGTPAGAGPGGQGFAGGQPAAAPEGDTQLPDARASDAWVPRPGLWQGTTSQGERVGFVVGGGSATVTQFELGYISGCDEAELFTHPQPMPVIDHEFDSPDNFALFNGQQVDNPYRQVDNRFLDETQASGEFRLTGSMQTSTVQFCQEHDAQGRCIDWQSEQDVCSTGAEFTWTAMWVGETPVAVAPTAPTDGVDIPGQATPPPPSTTGGSGVAGDTEVDPEASAEECADGDTQRVPAACGLNGRGELLQACAGGHFEELGECDDHGETCVDDSEQNVSCGVFGQRSQRCAAGQWQDEGECREPPEQGEDESPAAVQPGFYLAENFYFVVRADGPVSDFTFRMEYPLCPRGTSTATSTSLQSFYLDADHLMATNQGSTDYTIDCDFSQPGEASCTIEWSVEREGCAEPLYGETIVDTAVVPADQCDSGGPLSAVVGEPDADGNVPVEFYVLPWGADACEGIEVPDGTEISLDVLFGGSVEPAVVTTLDGRAQAIVSPASGSSSASLWAEVIGPWNNRHFFDVIPVGF